MKGGRVVKRSRDLRLPAARPQVVVNCYMCLDSTVYCTRFYLIHTQAAELLSLIDHPEAGQVVG